MDVDLFKDIIVPVVGGLGVFLLGLEFMEKGIHALSANKMRDMLAKMAGTPLRGVVAGTVITGIMFNFIGVCVVLALFFPAIEVLRWVMGFFGGDPGVPMIVDGKETFPLVPVAVGLFSIFFNIFNVLILFPFVNVMERFLSQVGRSSDEDREDYSVPRYLDPKVLGDYGQSVPLMQAEAARLMHAASVFLGIARKEPEAPKDPGEHYAATDALARQIRDYSAHLFGNDLSRDQMNLVASMIEEVDYTGSLAESMHQIARRVQREQFSDAGNAFVQTALGRLESTMQLLEQPDAAQPAPHRNGDELAAFEAIRWGVIDSGEVPANEKGAIVALLGSIERAEGLMARILAERASLDRDIAALVAA